MNILLWSLIISISIIGVILGLFVMIMARTIYFFKLGADPINGVILPKRKTANDLIDSINREREALARG